MSISYITPTAPSGADIHKMDPQRLAQVVRERFVPHGEPGTEPIQFDPVENVNYDAENITYTHRPYNAERILNIILQAYDKFSPGSELTIISPTAGIGGDIMVALDKQQVTKVVAYEMNPIRQDMLLRNLMQYRFNPSRYCVAGEFTGVPAIYTPNAYQTTSNNNNFTVLMMDPAWLPPGISGANANYADYLRSGATIGPYTVEEWIARSMHCDMITLFVPNGYELHPGFIKQFGSYFKSIDSQNAQDKQLVDPNDINGRRVTFDKHALMTETTAERTTSYHEADLYVFIPERGLNKIPYMPYKPVNDFSGVEPIDQSTWSSLAPIPECKTQPTPIISAGEMINTTSSVLGTIDKTVLTDMKFPTNEEADAAANQDDPAIVLQWVNGLIAFLKPLLTKIFNADYTKLLLNPSAIKVWIQAFTAKNVDPNYNYEALEYQGDKTLGSAFGVYLWKTIPNVTNAVMTNLAQIYMSKDMQPDFSEKLGVVPWLRTKEYQFLSRKVRGDLFESFAGALCLIPYQIIKVDGQYTRLADFNPGLGHVLVERLIEYLFDVNGGRFEIDMEFANTPIVNRLPQLFQGLYQSGDNQEGKWKSELALHITKTNIVDDEGDRTGLLYTMTITKLYADRIKSLRPDIEFREKLVLATYERSNDEITKSDEKHPIKLYTNAFYYLVSIGLDTLEFNIMQNELWAKRSAEEKYQRAKQISTTQGFDTIYIQTGSIKNKAELLGIKSNDRKNGIMLAMATGKTKYLAYEMVLNEYLNKFSSNQDQSSWASSSLASSSR